MTVHHDAMPVRWLFLISLLLITSRLISDIIAYPAIMTGAGAQAIVYPLLFGVAVVIYGWFALFRTRATTEEQRIVLQQGTIWGLLCGTSWILELLTANVVSPHVGWYYTLLYEGTANTAYLLPIVAGILAAWQTKHFKSGLQAGLLCGMIGGLMIFLSYLVLSSLFLQAGFHDPQTIHEFHQSGLPDLTTYIVSDYLVALTAHLWIGLLTGLLLGTLGGMIGKAFARAGRPVKHGN